MTAERSPEPISVLTPALVLDAWEAGRNLDGLGQALAVWHVVSQRPLEDLADQPIGQRDRDLLAARIGSFGQTAECYVDCSACGEGLEFELDLAALMTSEPSDATEGVVSSEDVEVAFRLPTTDDLRAIGAAANPLEALLERCIISWSRDGVHCPALPITPDLRERLDVAMRDLDPQADIEIKLDCVWCGSTWTVRFDIGAFLWREVELEARRVLREIHQLARSYGWSESEILALSPARRHRYVEMVSP